MAHPIFLYIVAAKYPQPFLLRMEELTIVAAGTLLTNRRSKVDVAND
jgi:hypothetical protein